MATPLAQHTAGQDRVNLQTETPENCFLERVSTMERGCVLHSGTSRGELNNLKPSQIRGCCGWSTRMTYEDSAFC